MAAKFFSKKPSSKPSKPSKETPKSKASKEPAGSKEPSGSKGSTAGQKKPFFAKFRKTSKEPGAPGKSKDPPKSEILQGTAPHRQTSEYASAAPKPGSKQPSPKPKSKITPPVIVAIILAVIIVLMIIGFSLYLVLGKSDAPTTSALNDITVPPPPNVCKTPQCIGLANKLHNWGDNTANPCENFFQYACGRFAEHVNFEQAALVLNDQLLNNVMKVHFAKIKDPMTKAEMAMKKFWDHCQLATSHPSKNGMTDDSRSDLFAALDSIGDFPMIGYFNSAKFKLNEYLANIAAFKLPTFGLFAMVVSDKVHILKEPINVEDYKNFQSYIPSAFLQATNRVWDSKVANHLNELVNFANELSALAQTPKQMVEISMEDLKNTIKKVDFERILRSLVNPTQYEQVKGKRVLIDAVLNEPGRLDGLIGSASARTLANFLIVHSFLSGNKFLTLETHMGCGHLIKEAMPELVLPLLVRHYFDKRNLEKASKIVEELQTAFRKMLESSTWLQESTKKNALKKLEKMRKVIGYQEEFMNLETIEKRFEKEVMVGAQASLYKWFREVIKFRMTIKTDEAIENPPLPINEGWVESNAFYSPTTNALMLAVPIMDYPNFDGSFPKYAQIASIGFITGHEIGHGFDPQGSQYDENGKQRDWWTQEDRTEFEKRAKCVIEKYNNYDDPSYGKQLNGTTTVDENVADILGAQSAWGAYKNVDLSKEQKIVGFEDYNTDKLFFQIEALPWCSPHSTRTLKSQLTDGHGVANYRVNGVFSNMKEFADTFNCAVGTKMNPAKKCPIF